MPALSKQEVPPWGLAVAGATGAVFANALVYPLDIVKTRLQVQVKHKHLEADTLDPHTGEPQKHYTGTWHAILSIMEDEGVSGLYAGMAGGTPRRREHQLRLLLLGKPPGTAAELSLGAVAGALAQLFTIPISVVTTRQQTQPKGGKKGMVATAKEVTDGPDGIAGLWRGLKASLVLVVNPAITYGAYERLREVLYPGKTALAAARSLPKALATIATQPLIVAKVGLQSRPPPGRTGKPFRSFVEVMQYIVQHEGPLGLYKGVAPQILKGLLVQGILMMTKERVEVLFILLFRYFRKLRQEKLEKLAEIAARKVDEARGQASQVVKA
ncbi:peroxisomal ATP carrier [Teratosphaeria destructans]|uniref:Peroxisomal ATP carrier n=1 Tax=Teratosphaeria destructans TaxID=418781 RepID=A0A9W7SKY4_9PEZI|nr:peroxisomal ATP carrier [Teratosphaeria destructans]